MRINPFKKKSSPLSMKLAGQVALGVGAVVLIRKAYTYYQNHPEIKDFFKENLQLLEKKLKEMSQAEEEKITH